MIVWSYFFNMDDARPPQASKRIDIRIAHSLIDLPTSVVGETSIPEEHSIAYRDLERGRELDLPSGEALARVMGVEPLKKEELGLEQLHMSGETPLRYYILKEAEVLACTTRGRLYDGGSSALRLANEPAKLAQCYGRWCADEAPLSKLERVSLAQGDESSA
jgi:hypothetical protein